MTTTAMTTSNVLSSTAAFRERELQREREMDRIRAVEKEREKERERQIEREHERARIDQALNNDKRRRGRDEALSFVLNTATSPVRSAKSESSYHPSESSTTYPHDHYPPTSVHPPRTSKLDERLRKIQATFAKLKSEKL